MLTSHALSSHAITRATAEGEARISQDTKGFLQRFAEKPNAAPRGFASLRGTRVTDPEGCHMVTSLSSLVKSIML